MNAAPDAPPFSFYAHAEQMMRDREQRLCHERRYKAPYSAAEGVQAQ